MLKGQNQTQVAEFNIKDHLPKISHLFDKILDYVSVAATELVLRRGSVQRRLRA